ncbi:hypothetical protein Q4503_11975 [Colwellia sp. 6_MG-2023]|uniref:hypothetical protein n=1 Tax=Colwellia sp. 6_MG-2023 TaxID=3062676 RepID=UPI0026E123D1|nr:hypothetical protein [Colwellia sp. 6_MG-2023]MDO6488424.1 hypothetical protein [Colwellia sp. 6_MG-2023]
MLKIKAYEEDSFSFYKEIVKSKNKTKAKPDIKEQLAAISDTQSQYFDDYDDAFDKNSLALMLSMPYSDNDKVNLKSLYNYRNQRIQALKNTLTKHPHYKEHILNTCQNCTINEVDSMDHVLGQTEFPEYSVHPKNLFPCCTACNRKKSDNYTKEDGSLLFLNLFIDDLPQSQYLKVDFDANWMPRFYLEQPDNVTDNVFNLIKSHYEQLDLLQRFRGSSSGIISTLKATIKSFKGLDINIGDKIDEQCKDQELFLGYNHRQIVIYRALGSSDDFIHECMG